MNITHHLKPYLLTDACLDCVTNRRVLHAKQECPRLDVCPTCKGYGNVSPKRIFRVLKTCPACKGPGEVKP
jgi:DnaJ-class molecular chaperone